MKHTRTATFLLSGQRDWPCSPPVEILALEESGNQTISVGFFRTAA